jgi:tetratricopeptide (TPR) repeat protein
VENESELDEVSQKSGVDEIGHSFDITQSDRATINNLQKSLSSSGTNKKSTIFADSLATIFLSYNILDSAEIYADIILQKDSSLESHQRAGNIYFRLFGVTLDQIESKRIAEKAAISFESILEQGPNPDVRAKWAMTKVSTSSPMDGILILREVLEEYPDNETALYSIGVLSMQSGQYDKAAERFEKLMTIDLTNHQAAYYLAVSYFELGQMGRSKEWFEKIKNVSRDPAILESTDQYLKKLNEL